MVLKTVRLFLLYISVWTYVCCSENSQEEIYNEISGPERHQNKFGEPFQTIDEELQYFNKLSSSIAWNMAIGDNNLTDIGIKVGVLKNLWRNVACENHPTPRNSQERRMMYLLCRGPKYTKEQAIKISKLLDQLSDAYTSTLVCFKKDEDLMEKSRDNTICLRGEPDLEKLMTSKELSESQLRWIWNSWYDSVGPKIKQYYPMLVELLNEAARNNNYEDIGECWREELEISDLEMYTRYLYKQIEPLYTMLHAVVRHKLVQKYGPGVIDPFGKIPAHLLGNLWAQDWSALLYLFYPENSFNINAKLAAKKWEPKKMVEMAEDYYISLGLPRMTRKFWEYSKVERTNSSICHGSAGNMFEEDDYRMLLCADNTLQDFYVIHHEMGHIQYYMAYKNQPAIFQDGANSALQESIGDAIMLGVMSPQHLNRLGLITDQQLYNNSLEFDEILMLHQALAKIPQIPFSLVLDFYRWEIFRGNIIPEMYNVGFWELNEEVRGIKAPSKRNKEYFDAGAKFHIPDNTPYIRYFLSSFIQVDIFKSLCQWSVFGNVSNKAIPFPLHRCDIYGSRPAGRELHKLMSKGASTAAWIDDYKNLTGRSYINVNSILEYFRPVRNWLKKYIRTHQIPVGWSEAKEVNVL